MLINFVMLFIARHDIVSNLKLLIIISVIFKIQMTSAC